MCDERSKRIDLEDVRHFRRTAFVVNHRVDEEASIARKCDATVTRKETVVDRNWLMSPKDGAGAGMKAIDGTIQRCGYQDVIIRRKKDSIALQQR